MYICFKIRGEVRKNCKSWERNQDCTEEVSRQPARNQLQETLGASHHLLQEESHPGTQESRDPGINGSTSPCSPHLPVIIHLQIHHSGSVSNQGATAPAGGSGEQSSLAPGRRGSKGRESLGTVALRKQTESQTSLPWKLKQREDSSPFINKAGRERGNFHKLKLLKITPGTFEEQGSPSTHHTATQTSSPSWNQPVCRQAAFPVIREGEGERGLRAGRSRGGGAEPSWHRPAGSRQPRGKEPLSPGAAEKTTAPTGEELKEPTGRALESSLPEMLLK